MNQTDTTGKPVDRIDGRLKVTGAAKFSAEFNQTGMVYVVPIGSTVANGTITAVDSSEAKKSAGVLAVLTPYNAPRLKALNIAEIQQKSNAIPHETAIPLQDTKVHYFGQFIACVVAETYEQARYAARLVRITYAADSPAINLHRELSKGFRPERALRDDAQVNTGKAAAPLAAAPSKIEQTYTTPTEVHNPIEPHSGIAVWDAQDKLTVYESTQGTLATAGLIAYFFNLDRRNVRVICPYVGGTFGSKGMVLYYLITAMAAQVVKRPVKIFLTRQMMQTSVGRRPETSQKIALGAEKDGKLSVIRHHSESYTSPITQFFEPSGAQTLISYGAPLREITYQVARLNVGSPRFMRGPGETPGSFALESAIDELASEMKIDPLNFRRMNHTTVNPHDKHPFSSENLLECYRTGAEKFGWSRRKAAPRQMREGNWLIGMGMAMATYPGLRSAATVRVQITRDGKVTVMCAVQEIGNGIRTIIAQSASDALGFPLEKITVEVGDSTLPPGPYASGSTVTGSVMPAVSEAGERLRKDLMQLALADPKSKIYGRKAEEIEFGEAKFSVRGDSSKSDSYASILQRQNKLIMEGCATTLPISGNFLTIPGSPCEPANVPTENNTDNKKYSFHSFGAQFAEVWVDADLGIARVKRFTTVIDVGRIMNEKTARSQAIGGVVWGIGQALTEETHYDQRFGNPVQRTFGDYHIPVHLDTPKIDVHFINKPDLHFSPIGARGIGEISITGCAAAIANAVFNATGRRVRDLPITPDKLM